MTNVDIVQLQLSQSVEHSISGTSIELEIFEDWWWWRGYPREKTSWGEMILAQTHQERYGLYIAPSIQRDISEFYDDIAFPSLKPDIDVFGVPRRSRKQRGWYQIIAPSTGQPSPSREIRGSWAIPSDVPPELDPHILIHLGYDDIHALASCGLVCRDWYKKCCRKLFRSIPLRSREDGLQLLSFMKTSDRVPYLVHEIGVLLPQKVSGPPWFHLFPLIEEQSKYMSIYMSESGMKPFGVAMEGPLPPGQRSLRSIHHALPRSLPHFSRHIYRVTLKDIQFAKLDDLMHLVWEMPDLQRLECKQVTWGPVFPIAPLRRKPSRPPSAANKFYYISLEDNCGPRLVEAGVWLSTCLSVPVLSLDDLPRVLTIARAFDAASIVYAVFLGMAPSEGFYIDIVSVPNRQDIKFRGSGTQAAGPVSIYTMIMEFEDFLGIPALYSELDIEPISVWRNIDWDIVGRAISSFHGLTKVVVAPESKEDVLAFDDVAKAHMPRLHSSGMFKYALKDPRNGKWVRASPDPDDTKPPEQYFSQLKLVYT